MAWKRERKKLHGQKFWGKIWGKITTTALEIPFNENGAEKGLIKPTSRSWSMV